MRFFPFFSFVFWNLGMLCPIDANDRDRELYFPAHHFFAERRLMKHRIRTMRVKDLDDCELLCYRDDNCVSLNIKDKDLDSGTHECELNNSTHLEHDGDLKSNPVYYYRGVKNACGKNRRQCENNGICQSGFTDKGYRCLYPLGFRGEHCEEDIDECVINNGGCHANANCQFTLGSFSCTCKSGYNGNGLECSDVDECSNNNGGCNADATCQNTEGSFTCTCKPGYSGDGFNCVEKWILMAPQEVCFGSKDDSYGAFMVLVPGRIITFKLTYLNGSVNCYKNESRFKSNWGCRHPKVLGNTTMGSHVTYSNKTRLLPKAEHLKGEADCLQLSYYHLPWVTIDSSELVFDNLSSPLAVTTNEEFQVWFGEDLFNCGDYDNGVEKTCARVYGLYA